MESDEDAETPLRGCFLVSPCLKTLALFIPLFGLGTCGEHTYATVEFDAYVSDLRVIEREVCEP